MCSSDLPMTALGFPGQQFVFFHQRLHRSDRYVEQLGRIRGATVFVRRVGNRFVAHEESVANAGKKVKIDKIKNLMGVYR